MTTSSVRSQAKAESNPVATSGMIRNAQRRPVEAGASSLAAILKIRRGQPRQVDKADSKRAGIGNPINSPVETAKVSNKQPKKVKATDSRVETSRTIPNALAKRVAKVDKA